MSEPSPPTTRLPFFAYGTLRRGESNFLRFLAGRLQSDCRATAVGRLFWVIDGDYPYMLDGGGTVIGDLFEIAPAHYEQTLRKLDELEEYDPSDETGSLYLRRPIGVVRDDGRRVTAWTYYWNGPSGSGVSLPEGDFRRRERR